MPESIKRHMARRAPPHYSPLTHIENAGVRVCAASAHALPRHRSLFNRKGSRVIHHWQQRSPLCRRWRSPLSAGTPCAGWVERTVGRRQGRGAATGREGERGAVGLWEQRDWTMWHFHTPHTTLSVQNIQAFGRLTLTASHPHLQYSVCWGLL